METHDLLLRGIAAARDGRREEARGLLLQVVEADERNERAWLWLSGVMDDPNDIRVCLENVLVINPANPRARQGIEWLDARFAAPAATPAVAVAAAPAAPAAPLLERAVGETPPPRRAPIAVSPPPISEPAAAPPLVAELCPYCGAPAAASARACLACGHSLLVETPPAEEPSAALGALGMTWLGGAGLTALLGLAFALLGLSMFQSARFVGDALNPTLVDAPYPLGTLIPAVLLLTIAGLGVSVARALARRAPWSLATAAALTAVGLLVAIALYLRAGDAPALLQQLGGGLPVPEAVLRSAPVVAAGVALVAALLHILAGALTALSYRDFVGPRVRFRPTFEPTDHLTHYNRGVAHKERQMWFLASVEWEEAVRKSPRDVNYLRALGLAYAQLKRYDQARATLDRALRIAPGHQQLGEERALVDRLAAEGA